MTDKERDIRVTSKRIKDLQDDINELKRDLKVVRGSKSITMIEDEIKRLEKFKERQEFKLWKLEREGLNNE